MSNVDHPSHYNIPGKKECIEQMVDSFGLEMVISFCLMNAYKYLYRAGEKADNPKEQDIEKAKWYFNWVHKQLKTNTQDFTELRNFNLLRNAYLYIKLSLEAIDNTKEEHE